MNISEIFGSNVFNETVMKERLPKKVFAEVMTMRTISSLVRDTAVHFLSSQLSRFCKCSVIGIHIIVQVYTSAPICQGVTVIF